MGQGSSRAVGAEGEAQARARRRWGRITRTGVPSAPFAAAPPHLRLGSASPNVGALPMFMTILCGWRSASGQLSPPSSCAHLQADAAAAAACRR